MPAQLYATLIFDVPTIEDLLRTHVETLGYFVETIEPTAGDTGYKIFVRPMTNEERALHDLPVTSVEDRLQERLDSLVEDTTRTFSRFQSALERQARDTESALANRLEDLEALTQNIREAMTEIQELAEQTRNAVPEPLDGPIWEAPAPRTPPAESGYVATVDPLNVGPRSGRVVPTENGGNYETLSFADAAASLQHAAAARPVQQQHRARFAQLHRDLEREAADAANAEEREPIYGESNTFPSDLATK